ncbi:hypothetical protein JCM8097_007549 [Rhodosporidiobolus ruineniae]
MELSTSNASEEEGVADEKGMVFAQGEQVDKPSPLDRVPNEILSRILSFSCDPEASDKQELARLAVNKRVYAAPRAAAYSVVAEHSALLFFLVRSPDLHQHPRRLSANFIPDLPIPAVNGSWAMFSLFTNLTAIEINYSAGAPDNLYALPRATTDTLRSLPHLDSLRLSLPPNWTVEDPTFTLGQDVPRLRRLHLRVLGGACGLQLLCDPLSRLRDVTLTLSDVLHELTPRLPWSSITRLRFEEPLVRPSNRGGAAGVIRPSPLDLFPFHPVDRENFGISTPLPLKHLDLAFPAVKDRSTMRGLPFTQLQTFLHSPFLAGVEHLALKFPQTLPPVDEFTTPLSMTSVLSLDVEARAIDFTQPVQLLRLAHLLDAFPSLDRLTFRNLHFAPVAAAADLSPSSPAFELSHAGLCTLVRTTIRSSGVLVLDWMDPIMPWRYRWVRRNREEDFQVDRYSRE